MVRRVSIMVLACSNEVEGNHALDVHFQGVGKYDRFVGGVDKGFYQHGGTIRPYFPIWTSDKKRHDPELNPDGVYPRIHGYELV